MKIKLVCGQNRLKLASDIETATIKECYEYIRNKKVLGLDIETTRKFNKYLKIEGLDPYTSNIVMLQIGDNEKQFIIDTRTVDISIILPIFSDKSITKVGHNIKFEYKHILHNYEVKLNNVYDTMIVEQILYNGYSLRNSLAELNKRYLNLEVDKSTRLGFLTIGSRPFTEKEIRYGTEDIINPLLIRLKQLKDIKEKEMTQLVRLEMKFLLALGDIEYTGINLNTDKWKDTYNKNIRIHKEYIDKLNKFIVENYSDSKFIKRQLDLFITNIQCNIKWSSSKQVIEFFKHLNVCPRAVSKTTKKESYTVEAKEIKMLLLEESISDKIKGFIKTYLKSKEYEQATTTFGIKFLEHINPITGRIHSNYKQILNTGRISSSKPNNQNIPARHEFRYAFDAPKSKVIVNADYSGQENIILANKSMDKDLLEFYDKDLGDMHSFIAKKLFPKELENVPLHKIKEKRKDLRQIAKAAGFAINKNCK